MRIPMCRRLESKEAKSVEHSRKSPHITKFTGLRELFQHPSLRCANVAWVDYYRSVERKQPRPQAKGITPVAFEFKIPESIKTAISTSRASLVWFTTDFYGAAGNSKEREIEHGAAVIAAC